MKRILLLSLLFIAVNAVNAQRRRPNQPAISVSNARSTAGVLIDINKTGETESTYTPQQLVENVLFSGCVNLSNFSSVVAGTAAENTTKSYGFFKKTAGSTFPFESGIVLTNGKAYEGGNVVVGDPDSAIGTGSDTDLEAALGITGTGDRTVFEFDFVPSANAISFKFLMASSEYQGDWPCQFADGFAFLLKPVGGATYTNLAIVTGTTIPISCITVHPANQADGTTALTCGASNATFFDGYALGDTNYKGRTKVFTATSAVTPGTTYHIKMVVADQTDTSEDAAIFLEAGSFDIGTVDVQDINGSLGSNQDLCSGDAFTEIHVDHTAGATYQWQLLNTVTSTFENIVGATNNTYTPTQDGTYKIIVTFGAGGCTGEDTVIITHHVTPTANQPTNLLFCDANNDGIQEHINLSSQSTTILGAQDATLFEIRYFASAADYTADTPITTPADYTNTVAYTQTITAEIRNINNNTCLDTTTFEIRVYDNPTPATPANIPAIRDCDNTSVGTDIDGIITFDLTQNDVAIRNGQTPIADFNVRYYTDAGFTTEITTPASYQNTTMTETIYILVENVHNPGCSATTSFEIEVFALPTITTPIDLKQCDDDTDGISVFNLTEADSEISTNAATETFTYYESLTNAQTGTAPIADAIHYTSADANTVWATVVNNNGCQRIAQVDLFVSATAIPNTFHRDFYACDEGVDPTDGFTAFDFSSANTDILSLFSATQQPHMQITYYAIEADALAETNVIPDISNYTNTIATTHIIWVRVDNDLNNDCVGFGPYITLHVEPIPIANTVAQFRECDDDADDLFPFDTSALETTLLGGQTGMHIDYFEADGITPLTDAGGVAITQPFPNTFLYGNVGSPGVAVDIIAVLTDTTGTQSCSSVPRTISFIVDDSPVANPVTITVLCDLDENGIQTFDTSTLETTLLGGQTGMNVTYFEADGTTPLTDNAGTIITSPFPATFISTTKDIIAVVTNPLNTTCVAQTTINIIVNPLPQFDITTPRFVCLNLPPITLSAENPDNATYSYEWVKDATVVGNLIDLVVNNGGDYTVTATNTVTGCTKSKLIHVDESEIADFGMDDIVITDVSDNNMVEVITAGGNLGIGDYQFSMDTGVYQDEPLFEHVHAGIHTITVDDKNTCGTVTLTIAVVGFPKYVTPNADGYNDVWQALGLDFQPASMIYIYDRYGKLIYTQRANQRGWAGLYNGFEAPASDYWYRAVLEDGRTIYGHFALKR
jgi:gliding motility-associated-like protein